MSLSVVFILALLGFAAPPATAPVDSIRAWFNQLTDSNPDTREQARVNLMGLNRADLSTLRQIVAESRPLRAAQSAVLYDIVTHAYAAGEPYGGREVGCVLGVQLAPSDDPTGVRVAERFAGFCAYRFLRDGDVIVGIVEAPGVVLNAPGNLSSVLGRVPRGTRLTFEVMRNGQTLSIPIRLDAAPAAAVDMQTAIQQLRDLREQRAVEYWSRKFAPLLEDQGMTSADQ